MSDIIYCHLCHQFVGTGYISYEGPRGFRTRLEEHLKRIGHVCPPKPDDQSKAPSFQESKEGL